MTSPRNATFITVAFAAALLLGGCGDSAGESDATAKASATSSEAESSDVETGPSAAATCTLKGKRAPTVTLAQDDDSMTLAFDGHAPSQGGTVLYSATVFDDSGETGVQLGMKFQGGQPIAYFVFDFTTNEQTNLDGQPEVSGENVSGTFPNAALGDLVDAGPASWSANLSLDGNDVGQCPGGIDSLPFPA